MTKSKKILIVEDDVDILEALGLIFESDGYEVHIASKGDDVMEAIYSFYPDVIILDIFLSGTDGRTLCKIIKNNSQTSHIPIIMTSAHPDASKSVETAGADDFIAKPFDINEILKVVGKYV